jgi:hypothetical protein
MFDFNAFKNGRLVTINPESPVVISIPTDYLKAGMSLYEGELDSAGQVNWVNPVPLDNPLTPADILSLDFYPPRFVETAVKEGYDPTNKRQMDSVFYSYYCLRYSHHAVVVDYLDESVLVEEEYEEASEDPVVDSATSTVHNEEVAVESGVVNCGIEPSMIKGIWNRKYQGTLLATKEFEDRLQIMYGLCDVAVFELYRKNLNEPMWKLDSMAAQMTSGEVSKRFRKFSEERKGGIAVSSKAQRKLNNFFEKSARAQFLASMRALKTLLEENYEADVESMEHHRDHAHHEGERKAKNFQAEYDKNLAYVTE